MTHSGGRRMIEQITIGKLAKMSGVSTRTIRYYEDIGLLECAAKTDANYRLYGDKEIKRLEKIMLFKSLGFSLEEIKTILETEENQKITQLFKKRMRAFEQKMTELSQYKEMLKAITRIYKAEGIEYVDNYHLMKEMITMNNMFSKTFNKADLELQIKVIKEIYRTGTLTPDTLKEMGIQQGSQLLKELHIIIVKSLLMRTDKSVEKDIIISLEKTDPDFAEELKKAIFTFEDILILPDATIKKWLEKCDDQQLAIALTESGNYLKNRIILLMESDRAERVKRKINELEVPSLDEVYSAMTSLIDILRELEMKGEIKIRRFN